MKKLLTRFFVVLGVIFFALLLVVGGVVVYLSLVSNQAADATIENQQPAATDTTQVDMNPADTNADITTSNPMLNARQEAALETFGVDPASLPTEVTDEQEACFIEAIGADRVAEIKAGDSPTPIEIFRGSGCL